MSISNELAGHFLREASALNSRATASADLDPLVYAVVLANLCELSKFGTKAASVVHFVRKRRGRGIGCFLWIRDS